MHWKITSLWGGKKVELRETQRAVTRLAGWWCFSNSRGGSAMANRCGSIWRSLSVLPLRSIR